MHIQNGCESPLHRDHRLSSYKEYWSLIHYFQYWPRSFSLYKYCSSWAPCFCLLMAGRGHYHLIVDPRRYIKERANRTVTKPNSNLFNVWERSLNSWCSCSCLRSMRWQISCYLGQSEDRGCSIALHNSWLIYFALSFIHLLGVRGSRGSRGTITEAVIRE